MARIAEDALLLLLDNPEEQPCLERTPLARMLAGALILDLSWQCRVRPTSPDEPLPPGRLVVLTGPVPLDPSVRPALRLLEQRLMTPAEAIAALRKQSEDTVLDQLLRTGQIHQVQLSAHKVRRNHYRWPVKNRGRVAVLRSEVIGVLFQGRQPEPAVAAVICLLNEAKALQGVLELNDEGARVVDERARQIQQGRWADDTDIAGVNLARTLPEVLAATRG